MVEILKQILLLFPVGVCVGLIGSLIGVGGGFFVVPFLLLAMKGFTKESATAASLGIVLLSALSGTWANARRKRIDYSTGLLLAAGTLPGAWMGRELIRWISPRAFSLAFAGLLMGVAAYLVLVRLKPGQGVLRGASRAVVDSDGQAHRYELNRAFGLIVSLLVGVISSLFGIGGGLVLVPFLVIAFGAPMVISTAMAQFVFVFTSAVGLGVALGRGQMTAAGGHVILEMGLGVVVGAQLGVALAKRLPQGLVKGILAAVIVGVAALMVFNR